jgi:DNA processing protein
MATPPAGPQAGTDPAAREARIGRIDEFRLALLWRLKPRDVRLLREGIARGRWAWEGLLDRGGPEGRARELPEGLLGVLSEGRDRQAAAAELERMGSLGDRFLTDRDPGFPPELCVIPDPPASLFVRGDPFRDPGLPRIGIVGSRAASPAGREIARSLARDLALSGAIVVSGLARGIDGEAHRGALAAGGTTVAVLGTGVDLPYPPEHADLHREISRHGGLVSEFPSGTPPLPLHFPRRNRILAGLSDVIVIVEGRERSGARSTVDHALDQGKEVLAVPRDILHPGAVLPNRLLSEGARPVTSFRDVLDAATGSTCLAARRHATGARQVPAMSPEGPGDPCDDPKGIRSDPTAARPRPFPPEGMGSPSAGEGPPSSILSGLRSRIVEMLSENARTIDQLRPSLPGTPLPEIQSILLELEVLGWVRRLPGGTYRVAGVPGAGRRSRGAGPGR